EGEHLGEDRADATGMMAVGAEHVLRNEAGGSITVSAAGTGAGAGGMLVVGEAGNEAYNDGKLKVTVTGDDLGDGSLHAAGLAALGTGNYLYNSSDESENLVRAEGKGSGAFGMMVTGMDNSA